jgi:hypothetical protein
MGDPRVDSTQLRVPLATEGPQQRESPRVLAAFVLIGLCAAFAPLPMPMRSVLFFAISGVWAVRAWLRRRSARTPRGWVVVNEEQVVRADDVGITTIFRWDEPFGVTVFADQTRARALLAFTATRQTRYLAVRLTEGHAPANAMLFAQAITVDSGDLEMALGPRGGAPLSATGAAALLRTVATRASAALARIYLSDPRGMSIVLEPYALHVGDRTIDLTAPLELRVFSFQEGASGAATVYQGAWVRQGGAELVLVSPFPAEQSSLGVGRVHDSPPSRELRVAVDRLFMPPLRQALERAPRISRAGVPSHGGPRAVQT